MEVSIALEAQPGVIESRGIVIDVAACLWIERRINGVLIPSSHAQDSLVLPIRKVRVDNCFLLLQASYIPWHVVPLAGLERTHRSSGARINFEAIESRGLHIVASRFQVVRCTRGLIVVKEILAVVGLRGIEHVCTERVLVVGEVVAESRHHGVAVEVFIAVHVADDELTPRRCLKESRLTVTLGDIEVCDLPSLVLMRSQNRTRKATGMF